MSATTGFEDRRKRATTVSPAALVKLTKKRPVVAASGGNARPRSPCSPVAAIVPRRSSRFSGASAPLRTTRINPRCSTTNWTVRSVGSWTNARGFTRPSTKVRGRSCASASDAVTIRIETASTALFDIARIIYLMPGLERSRIPAAVFLVFLTVACGKNNPPAPSPGTSPGESVTGGERLGWDQAASTAAELATFRYVIYVDGVRSELTGVTCGTTAGAAGYQCSGRLPAMTAGSHTLELATYTDAGSVIESAKSSPLRVTVAGSSAGSLPATIAEGDVITSSDGVRMRV